VVLRQQARGGSYSTAFFEAFPREPKCFIRGEGDTVEAAEGRAYETYERYLSCDHSFDRLNKQGRGKCTECGLTTDDALANLNTCNVCEQEGARFLSPFGSVLDEGGDNLNCLPCLIETVIPQFLDTPLQSLKPAHLDENREDANDWYAEKLDALIIASLVPDLAQYDAFANLNASAQADLVQRLTTMVYRNILRQKMRIMGQFVTMGAPGITYLDDGGILEALCTDTVATAGADMAKLIWLRGQNDSENESRAAIDASYKALLAYMVEAIYTYAENCEDQPPPFGDTRKRAPSEDEFKRALGGIAEALAIHSDDNKENEEE
jgi:hypothetical protein